MDKVWHITPEKMRVLDHDLGIQNLVTVAIVAGVALVGFLLYLWVEKNDKTRVPRNPKKKY